MIEWKEAKYIIMLSMLAFSGKIKFKEAYKRIGEVINAAGNR